MIRLLLVSCLLVMLQCPPFSVFRMPTMTGYSNSPGQPPLQINLFHSATGRRNKCGERLWQQRRVWLLPTLRTSGYTHLRTMAKVKALKLTASHSLGHLDLQLSQRTPPPRRMLAASRLVTMVSPTWRDGCGSSKPPCRCCCQLIHQIVFP